MVGLLVAAGGQKTLVWALVDSGAAFSSFPYSVADDLGITASLRRGQRREGAGAKRFRTWYSTVPITAQVTAVPGGALTVPDKDDDDLFIGPELELRPDFVKARRGGKEQRPVVGRHDFMRTFAVRVDHRAAAPSVTLEW